VPVRNGRINRATLEEQVIGKKLCAKLRDSDVESVSEVKLAIFESNGDFTVM
jgi:uncharacterized membrane protein YcaP (DUF421 family)